MRNFLVVFGVLFVSAQAAGQSDVMMLLNPFPNEDTVILNNEFSGSETVEDGNNGDDFGMLEHRLSLRYALKLEEEQEYYLMVDSHAIDIDSKGRFDNKGGAVSDRVRIPSELYNVGAGLMFRKQVHDTWKVGGTIKVGSASDELFHSKDEWYLHSIMFLQVPHLKHTSWVFLSSVDTNREYPILPGFGYAFPLSERAFAVVGLPFFGTAGQITDKWAFQLSYWPLRNAYGRLSYQATDRVMPYAGFRWRGTYFSRAGREDTDDRILLEDRRAFGGVSIDVTKKATLDLKGGLIFLREIGEGEDRDELDDNDIDIDNAMFASLALNVRF